MTAVFRLSWLWSHTLWLNKRFLWLLMICNGLGTIYGYIWYGNQLTYTYQHMATWLLPFVPDSPTASLFFTFALLFLAFDRSTREGHKVWNWIRVFVEAFAVITSIKYGVWAVWMIVMAYTQGDPIVWQEYMLICSHLAMAVEALLYARFFRYGWGALALTGLWTFTNDWLDYKVGIYPWLPNVLEDDDLLWIERFTMTLSAISIALAWLSNRLFKFQRSSK